ncbi:MAG: F0F1 ATP synthase subunit gamma [Magnetovibrionaceae bacterium]
MPSLKDLKVRINSVKSTRKITSAMKMVAAAKLRRAEESAQAARPYAERMERMLGSLAGSLAGSDGAPKMLSGTGKDDVHLLVVMAADRGLCGAFNGSILREARRQAMAAKEAGKTVKFIAVGKRAVDGMRRVFGPDVMIATFTDIGKRGVEFHEADEIATKITDLFEAGEFDTCTMIFNRFQSAMTQIVTPQKLIPFEPAADAANDNDDQKDAGPKAIYTFEPDETEILEELLPSNLAIQIFQGLLENSASEFGARMTAMDNATRNAGDMIDRLTITYNRTRQAAITKELIEIISGAEAL